MSVDEARENVVAAADEYAAEQSAWDNGAGNRLPDQKRAHLHAALDELVCETQAAMPCSGRYAVWLNDGTAEFSEPCDEQTVWRMSVEHFRRDDTGQLPVEAFESIPLPIGRYCPTCTARAGRAEAVES